MSYAFCRDACFGPFDIKIFMAVCRHKTIQKHCDAAERCRILAVSAQDFRSIPVSFILSDCLSSGIYHRVIW